MYAATMDGLNHWHKHAFEKLGWMVLAYNRMSENKFILKLLSIIY